MKHGTVSGIGKTHVFIVGIPDFGTRHTLKTKYDINNNYIAEIAHKTCLSYNLPGNLCLQYTAPFLLVFYK